MTAPTLQIKRLEERVKELEAALRPFADVAHDPKYPYEITSARLYRNGVHRGNVDGNAFDKAYDVLCGKLAAERPEVE